MSNLIPPNLRWLGLHPGADELLAFLDGELDEPAAGQVRQHLAKCARCRQKSSNTEAVLSEIREIVSAPLPGDLPVREAFADLQSAIQTWHLERSARGAAGVPLAQTDLGKQLSAVLEVYLGSRATRALLENAGRDEYADERLMTAMAPMLRTFLGRESADALEMKMRAILSRERKMRASKPIG